MDVKRKRIVGGVAAVLVAVVGAGAAIASGHDGGSAGSAASPRFGGNGGGSFQGGPPGGYGFGGGPGGRAGGRGLGRADDLPAAASYLGVSVAALRSDLQGGKTLAQVAAATSGKTAAGLIAALVAQGKATIGQQVTAGTLMRSQADRLEASLQQRVAAEVDRTGFGGHGGFGGLGGRPGGGGSPPAGAPSGPPAATA